MKPSLITVFAYVLISVAILLAFWFLIFGGYLRGDMSAPDPAKAKDIQPFVSGLVLPLLTLGSTLLVIANLISNTVQNFSSNFFKLIDQHHKLVDNLASAVERISTEAKPSLKRDFFDDLCSRIAKDYYTLLGTGTEKKNQIDKVLIDSAKDKEGKELLMCIYNHYFHIHHSDLSHYFRNLYHIVKFVERSSLRDKQKVEFVKMLRAQLSNYELLLLAYNGLHRYGKAFHPLIEKYQLLKNLNNERHVPVSYEKRIVDIEVLTGCYSHLKYRWERKVDGEPDKK